MARKLEPNQLLWQDDNTPTPRPASGLGSEDLVSSIVANIAKAAEKKVFDHPSINDLKIHKISKIVILDDSIGSGGRVSEYLEKFLRNKTIVSWLSYAKIKFYIISYARMIESTSIIAEALPGSNHGRRKNPKSSKIKFISALEYHKNDIMVRWGKLSQEIISLCRSHAAVPDKFRLGYDKCMSNIIFSHSIPNNTPGCLWYENKKNIPLFPRRTVPSWLLKLLNDKNPNKTRNNTLDPSMIIILQTIKSGIRRKSGLSLRIGIEPSVMDDYIEILHQSGLITTANRLTKRGLDIIMRHGAPEFTPDWDLYIPQTWCVDH